MQIDTIVDDKKDLPFDVAEIVHAVKKLVTLDESADTTEMLAALKADSSIMIPLGQVRQHVLALENAVKAEHNKK